MDPNLTTDEYRLVSYLEEKGLSPNAARVYALTLSRQYKAPKETLVDILAFFTGLGSLTRVALVAEVDNLVQRELLHAHADAYVEASDPVDSIKRGLLYGDEVDSRVADLIAERINSFAPGSKLDTAFAERVGWATWPEARQALSRTIAMASETIRLGMFSSISAYAQLSLDIRDALARRVNVRLLMFSPDLARQVEHTPVVTRDVQVYVGNWKKLYEDLCREKGPDQVGQFEIRLLAEKMLAVHRSLLVDDGKIWLLNIHRPGRDRGTEGLVYRGSCELGETTIYNMLDYYWEAAWKGAVTPGQPTERPATRLRKNLVACFSEDEIRTLCFDMQIDYDDLGGGGKSSKVRELVAYCERHNRFAELERLSEKPVV